MNFFQIHSKMMLVISQNTEKINVWGDWTFQCCWLMAPKWSKLAKTDKQEPDALIQKDRSHIMFQNDTFDIRGE